MWICCLYRQGPVVTRLDFIGIGAARAGSTWIAKCLQEHPQIYIPMRKELHLFNNDRRFKPNGRLNLRGRLALLRNFSKASRAQVRGEFTPRYMISPMALRRIALNVRDVKVIGILRDPVERAFSQYNYFKYNKRKEPCPDFESALTGQFHEDYIVKSTYTPLVKNVFDTFPADNIKLLIYDDISARPREVIKQLFGFLGVDDTFNPASLDQFVNYAFSAEKREDDVNDKDQLLQQISSGSERSQNELSHEVRMRVYERYFTEDINELEQLLDRDLSAWKASVKGSP